MHQVDCVALSHSDQQSSMMTISQSEDSYFIKLWKDVYGHRSLQVFYSTKTHSFWAILETQKGFQFIPATRNGFDLIKVPLLECSTLRNSIANFQNSFSSPSRIVEFFRKEIRYPIITETSAGYIIQLNGSGLLGGGGCTFSKIELVAEQEVQTQARNVSSEEYKQVVKFLSDRYGVTLKQDNSSNDKRFIEKLAEKISRALSPDEALATNKHLSAFIDVYEEEHMDEVVLEMLGRSLEDGKPQLTDYTNNFGSDNLCIELLRKCYFSRERAKGGLEQEITERILTKLLEEIQPSGNDYKRKSLRKKNMNQKEEFRRVFLVLKTRDRITSLLNQVSNLTTKKVFKFIKDKLQLRTENEKEIVDQLCVSPSSDQILNEIINKVLPLTLEPGSEESFVSEDGKAPVFQINDNPNQKEEDVFSLDSQSYYLNKTRLKVLTELSLLSHDLTSLVELHNLLKADLLGNSKASSMNSALFEAKDILMNVIRVYKENEANLGAGELKSLLSLAFVQDSKIFRAFLEAFLMDLTTDILFDPQKVRMVSLILISAMRNPDFQDYLQVDDLSKCLKILQPMIEDLSITSDNVNVQEAMSSLNDILFLMGFIGAKGIKGDYLQTVSDLTKYMQTHSLEKVYNIFKGNAKDPSLEIKREYTLEALKRIETTSFETWQQNAASLVQAGQIAMQLGKGVFLSDLSSINEALLQIKDLLIQSYIGQPKTWYDNVNDLRFLEHEPIDKIVKDLFVTTRSYDRNYTFFVAEFLLKVIAQPQRKLIDKKIAAQALWSLANGYDYRESKIQRVAVVSKTYKHDPDIILYVQQSLATQAQNADLDFSVYVRKLLEGPIRIDPGNMNRANLPASLKQLSPAVVSQKSNNKENPGKQFYLNVLSQRKPRLYAIAQIQERCERTLDMPAILIDFRGVDKEKDFDETFMRKVEKRLQKISNANANDSIPNIIKSFHAKTTTKADFYDLLERVDYEPSTSIQESKRKNAVLDAIKEKAEEISKTNTFNIFDVFENFLIDPSKQVMVIQGDAGTGKTLLLRLCEHALWKRYYILSKADPKNLNRLPIRIILSEVKSFNRAVDEFLLEYGCDARGVQTIKEEPAVIFFDGYDEINQYINLYNLNNLDAWGDVKVVFTSRKENLTSLKEDYLYCFTPGKDKDKVLSYSIQDVDEEQSVKYIIAQMADKKHLICNLKQTLQTFNHISSNYMPVSNMLLRKIDYVKKLRQGSRHQCLKDTLKIIQEQLPEIKAVQNELLVLETDKLKVLPLVDTAKQQITQLKKLGDKSYIETVLNTLEMELLGPIKEAEIAFETARLHHQLGEKKKKPLAEDKLLEYFKTGKAPRKSQEISRTPSSKDYRESTSMKKISQGLNEMTLFVKNELMGNCPGGKRESLDPSKAVLGIKQEIQNSFEDFVSPLFFKGYIESFKRQRQNIRDVTEFVKNNNPDAARECKTMLVNAESVASNLIRDLENCSDFDRMKSLLDQISGIVDEILVHEQEIFSLVWGDSQSQLSQTDCFIEERNIDTVKLKTLYLKIEEKSGRFQQLQEELRSLWPDWRFDDGGPSASDFNFTFLLSKLGPSQEGIGGNFSITCTTIDFLKTNLIMTLDKFTNFSNALKNVLDLVAGIYYLLHISRPLTTLNERVIQAQTARKELKTLKLLQQEGSDIVKTLDQQATLVKSFGQKKFEPIIQRLNQLSQTIKVYERELKVIKDDYTEESLQIKVLTRQIQDLAKFTDPDHLGPIIYRFKDLIKSPFILKMLTETLVKFPQASASKAELYRLFVSIHFEREKDKLLQTENIPSKFNILNSFYQYSKDLAVNMYVRNVVSLRAKDYDYIMGRFQSQTENIWQSFFDYEDVITRLARRGAQIVEEDGIVRFAHKSILEYFIARTFYDEIIYYDPDNIEDFNFYLNKKLLLTNNETPIFEFIQDMAENEPDNINKGNGNLNVFEKKLVQVLSSSSLYKKYGNFEENYLYANLFLLLLSSQKLRLILKSGRGSPTFIAFIIKIFEWFFSASGASHSFFEVILQLIRNNQGNRNSAFRHLAAFYYHEISKQNDAPQFNDKFVTSKRNIHLKVTISRNKDVLSITDDGKFFYTLEGKFFINDSHDSIVVLRAEANGKYLALDLETIKSKGFIVTWKGTLIDTATPWSVPECKWILRLRKSNEFQLMSLAHHSGILIGNFENPAACTPLFGDICWNDLFSMQPSLPLYKCVTCGLDDLEFCENCIEHCHKGHNIIDMNEPSRKDPGVSKPDWATCKCRSSRCCKILKLCRPRLVRNSERYYQCSACADDQKNTVACLTCTMAHRRLYNSVFAAPLPFKVNDYDKIF